MSRIGHWIVVGALALLWSGQAHAQSQHAPDWERERIQTHLRHIEELLRSKDVSHLSPEQREARERNLDRLHDYIERGRFPLNTGHPDQRIPYFIDVHGTACAVGHLVIESGHDRTAKRIARENNNAYIYDLRDDLELRAWADDNGFTLEELALIQPTYSYDSGSPVADAGHLGEDAGQDAGTERDAAADAEPPEATKDGGCAAGGRPEDALAALPLLALALLTRRARRREP